MSCSIYSISLQFNKTFNPNYYLGTVLLPFVGLGFDLYVVKNILQYILGF